MFVENKCAIYATLSGSDMVYHVFFVQTFDAYGISLQHWYFCSKLVFYKRQI